MQYHANGFRPGDPDVHPAAPGHRRAGDPLPQTVDVLIAGSGPAGLCLAAQLARVPKIRTMLVEPKTGPMEKARPTASACARWEGSRHSASPRR